VGVIVGGSVGSAVGVLVAVAGCGEGDGDGDGVIWGAAASRISTVSPSGERIMSAPRALGVLFVSRCASGAAVCAVARGRAMTRQPANGKTRATTSVQR